jgi:hypothetical protein
MWQYIVVGLLVLAATVYAARKLGPRRWRAKQSGAAGTDGAAAGNCGCSKDGKACH